jgi:hypothetical protein
MVDHRMRAVYLHLRDCTAQSIAHAPSKRARLACSRACAHLLRARAGLYAQVP